MQPAGGGEALYMISIDDIAGRQMAISRSPAVRRTDLDRYSLTMNGWRRLDVIGEPAFQRAFNGLYIVRRGEPWPMAHLGIMGGLQIRYRSAVRNGFARNL